MPNYTATLSRIETRIIKREIFANSEEEAYDLFDEMLEDTDFKDDQPIYAEEYIQDLSETIHPLAGIIF